MRGDKTAHMECCEQYAILFQKNRHSKIWMSEEKMTDSLETEYRQQKKDSNIEN